MFVPVPIFVWEMGDVWGPLFRVDAKTSSETFRKCNGSPGPRDCFMQDRQARLFTETSRG